MFQSDNGLGKEIRQHQALSVHGSVCVCVYVCVFVCGGALAGRCHVVPETNWIVVGGVRLRAARVGGVWAEGSPTDKSGIGRPLPSYGDVMLSEFGHQVLVCEVVSRDYPHNLK